ncbi:hypothetical protein KI659_03320 [Litoribacter alkaliphilus]|uniref:Uncharacterized protein n=1 Tax=Litoribacter ruber TaxID=702568 RepID=A0AAP2G0L1_9BACT|nr:hypothetical protein [Litoribacter alkaliphilus]MBS9523039.1 hypothetical protein [Litoribacter alkaliphilus]
MGILGLAITGFLGFFFVRTIVPTYFMKNKENLHLKFNKSKSNRIHFIVPSLIQDVNGQKFGWITLDSEYNLVAIKEHVGFGSSSGVLMDKTLAEFKKDLSKASFMMSFDATEVSNEFDLDGKMDSPDLVCLKALSAEFARKAGIDTDSFGLAKTLENLFGADAKDFDVTDLGINLLLQAKVVQKFGQMNLIPAKVPVMVN